MLRTQNKIKFSLQHSKLLKIAIFMIGSVFFTTGNANLHISDQTEKPENYNSYFLDIDNLRPSCNSGYLIIYTEKENPSEEWIVLPIKSSMRDYYKTVANVVATEFHKRIDEHSLVPHTKFLIGMDNNRYQLLGSVYKKVPSTMPLLEVMEERGFKDHINNIIYKDHNIEHNIGTWNYLGLPTAPSYAVLELSKDNKFVRYDYYNAFQYYNSEIHRKCFCTSYFPISDYNCSVEYIKIFEQELRSKHKETLEKVISEINIDSKKYLEGRDLDEVHQALKYIMNSKS